jgi:hypothetical protein
MRRARPTLLPALLLAFAGIASGQEAGSPLDNESIVRMLMSGASEREVIHAIQDAPKVAFDLDPEVVRELQAAGVSEKILEAMRARLPKQEAAPPAPAPAPQGLMKIRFRSAKAKSSDEPILFEVIKTTPHWAAEQMGMLQRPEVEDLAFFVLCTRPDHVPDHWQDRTELKDFSRHEKLLFRTGSHPAKSHGFEVMDLDLPVSLDVPVAEGTHRIVVGVAAKTANGWHVLGSDELKQLTVAPQAPSSSLLVTLSGKVVGSHMLGYKEESIVSVVDATATETAP